MKILRSSCVLYVLFTVLLGIVYPFVVYGIGQLFFVHHAEGTLLWREDGAVVGSHWIGQDFQKPIYFHPRPSSNEYDGANSGGSNLGSTSQKLIDILQKRAMQYRLENNLAPEALIPADAVTTSGSGLDPHISIENALLQAPRIASARNQPVGKVRTLIEDLAEEPFLGLFGTQRVNVLVLNLALDTLNQKID